ncbi:tRNA adenosine(34) deaminase TadA [Hylemonella sp. W303a]|uniref:tRNA adenosine(34) deaminase TadA n=1 Tax=Hylemonella sp. W303a TaxID=3389873 RepID=UPI00396AF706
MSTDQDYMRLALDQARLAAQAGEVPVGAVLVQQGSRGGADRVLATAHNTPIADHDPTAHAEMRALRSAGSVLGNYRLDDCTLYVTLEPCPMCAGAMLHARLKRVVYGAADPKTGAAGSVLNLFAHPQLNHQTEVRGGLLAEDCGALLQDFFLQRRQQARQAAHHDPARFRLREDALRTPERRFADLPNFPWTPRYMNDLPSLDGLRLHYLDEGIQENVARDEGATNAHHTQKGLTWLCLHGQGDWSYRHRVLIPQLLAQGHRVVAPDLIGFGRSDKPKKQEAHSLDWHLRVLREFVERLDLREVALLLPGEPKDVIAELGRRWAQAEPRRCTHTHYADAFVQDEPAELARAWDAPFPDTGHRAAPRAFAALTLWD